MPLFIFNLSQCSSENKTFGGKGEIYKMDVFFRSKIIKERWLPTKKNPEHDPCFKEQRYVPSRRLNRKTFALCCIMSHPGTCIFQCSFFCKSLRCLTTLWCPQLDGRCTCYYSFCSYPFFHLPYIYFLTNKRFFGYFLTISCLICFTSHKCITIHIATHMARNNPCMHFTPHNY